MKKLYISRSTCRNSSTIYTLTKWKHVNVLLVLVFKNYLNPITEFCCCPSSVIPVVFMQRNTIVSHIPFIIFLMNHSFLNVTTNEYGYRQEALWRTLYINNIMKFVPVGSLTFKNQTNSSNALSRSKQLFLLHCKGSTNGLPSVIIQTRWSVRCTMKGKHVSYLRICNHTTNGISDCLQNLMNTPRWERK